MKMNNKPNKEEIINMIIEVAYRDANIFIMFKVFLIISADKGYKKEYLKFRKTASMVHSIKNKNIELNLMVEEEKNKFFILQKIYTLLFVNPKYAAVLGTVLIMILFSLVFFQNNKTIIYSQDEIKYAELNVKYSFAVLGNILKQSKSIIKEGIVKNNLEKPINKSFQIMNDLNK